MNESSGNRDWVEDDVEELVHSLLAQGAKDVEKFYGHSIRSRANLLRVVNRAFNEPEVRRLMSDSE